ncbi:MAG: transporter substrate-binding domain-containing protein [Bacteroidales bacterium]|nr:transporter substrate-binding domain-containing protein [Bacteroidales bacterium]
MLKKGGRLDWVVFSESVSAFCLLLCVVLCSLFREAPSDPHSLREIRRDSTLCFGVLVNPMEYYVYQGKVGGFAYALGNAMADTWGVNPVYQVYYTYEDVCMALIQNEIDVMAVAEQASPEGCLFFAYTRPVMYTDVLRVRHKDSLSDAPCSMGLVASPALVEAAAAL